MIRAFIGIPVENQEVIEKILKIQKHLKNFSGIKLVEPQNLHFTLKFLGNISELQVEEIKNSLTPLFSQYAQFQILLKGIGVFPSENYIRVIWIGIEDSETLVTLMEAVDNKLDELGFRKENSYIPHLTIARVKKLSEREKLVKLLREIASETIGKFTVKKIVFYRSKLLPSGAMYTKICEWFL